MRTIKDIDLKDKKVIVRVDYNVPMKDGKIIDNNRIVSSLETINYLLNENARVILMSHMGKIKSEEDKKIYTLLPIKEELEKLLNKKVMFCSELKGETLEKEINNLKTGEILLLENTRYMDYPEKLESTCNEELSSYWASLADAFILDAFGSCHREHASTYGIAKHLPHAIGFLIEKEIKELDKIKNEKKTLILGGAKVSDKIGVIKNLLPKSEKVLIGGAMCATFLEAKGVDTGKTFVDMDYLLEARNLINTEKILLPIDVVTESGVKSLERINEYESILDLGPETIELYKQNLEPNHMVLLNGTLGKYEEEKYENATKEMFNYLKENNFKVVVCGGDGASAAKKYNFTPYYLSTGGGASLEYLEGKELPALKIMED